MEERTPFQKLVLAALAAMIVLFGVLTGVSKAHKGVLFDGALLDRTVAPGQTTYTGKVHGEAVTITVQNDGGIVTTVVYETETVHNVYTMEYPLDPIQTEWGAVDGIRILKNGGVLFQGGYDPNEEFLSWVDANGDWDTVFEITAYAENEPGPAGAPETLNYKNVAYFALEPELTARGSWALYAMLVFLTLLLMLDAAYPTVLFTMQHCCDVKDPEPSDLYIAMQKVGWTVYPFLLLAGYIWALRQFP